MKKTNLIVAIFAISFSVLSLGLNAEGIKARLAKRLPIINTLKADGSIGENNKGYLVARKELNEDNTKIIKDENADRKKIYGMLAKKTGQSVDMVGSRRAIAIAKKTKKGYWVQEKDGTWNQK